MRCVSWAPVMLMAVAAATPSFAQVLTEDEFLEEALRNHPGIAIAEAAVTAAEGNRRQAGIIDNPVLSWEREAPEVLPSQDTWRLDWRLPFDGRKHRVAAGDAAVTASSSDFEAARLGVRLEMRSLYAAWFITAERETILRAQLERMSRLADWLRSRADEGEAAGVEAHRLDLEVEVLDRDLATAAARTRARRAAAAAWGPSVTDEAKPRRPRLPVPPANVTVGDRPDLRSASSRAEEVEAEHRLAKRAVQPPAISLGWTEFRGDEATVNGPVVGLAWPLPVFDRNQGNREEAAAEASIARWQLALETRRAEQHARAALAAYTALYPTTRPRATDPVVDNVSLAVFAAFEAGEAGLTDVLDSLRASMNVRLARLANLEQTLAAERELEAAIGRPVLPGGSS